MSRIRRRPEGELEDIEDVGTLEGCGLGKGGKQGNVVGTRWAAGAETDFAEDDEGAQGAFGEVVGGWPFVRDEGKKLFVFRGVGLEAFAKSFGFGKGERIFAMGVEFGAQACDEGFLFLPGNLSIPGGEIRVEELGETASEVREKGKSVPETSSWEERV